MKISTVTDNQNYRKNVTTNEKFILRKMGLKFQNLSIKILYTIAVWNKQKRLNKELIIWSGLSR